VPGGGGWRERVTFGRSDPQGFSAAGYDCLEFKPGGIPMAEIARHVRVCTSAIADALRKLGREGLK
jgi:hypothetical protein